MLLRAFAAALLMLVPAPAAPDALPKPQASPIVQVICPMPGGLSMGTAFRVGPKLLLSVNHVTKYPGCTIEGRPIKVLYTSAKLDFSIITDGQVGPYLHVDCGGFVKGYDYQATGYARGAPFRTTVTITATGILQSDTEILVGIYTVIPGQSGGPVIDEGSGYVVGTINWYNMEDGISGSTELRETPICKRDIA